MNNHLPSSGTETVASLKHTDNGAWKILYKTYYPQVERFVLRNDGTVDDAKDIFQKTIIILVDEIPMDEIELASSLKTHIHSISSNLWLQRLHDSNGEGNTVIKKVLPDLRGCSNDREIHEANGEKPRTILNPIAEHCKKLLNLLLIR